MTVIVTIISGYSSFMQNSIMQDQAADSGLVPDTKEVDMKKVIVSFFRGAIVLFMLLIAVTVVCAQERQPMTPEKASTAERVRKQKEQIPTHEQRKSAADALKAERIKLLKAKQEAGLVKDDKAKKHNTHDKTQ